MMIPLSLYIHIPWCVRKCPYCDFNSHQKTQSLPEKEYIQRLLHDLKQDLTCFPTTRSLASIFIGGGTPSLFSADAYDLLLTGIQHLLPFEPDIEITLEANPGTVEQARFKDYRAIGINRLSLGIQSFNAKHLERLGRIHDEKQAHHAVEMARNAGFDNLNLDLMHGLPGQSVPESLADLQEAINHQPEHVSWYQLTIEPNTVFYKTKPDLPKEDDVFDMEETGFDLLQKHRYQRYEISAFCQPKRASKHNLNYWLFGDYYGIGAGAHGKLSSEDGQKIVRTRKHRQPNDYLNTDKDCLTECHEISHIDKPFEFILNTSRLEQAIPYELWTQRTGLDIALLLPTLQLAEQKGLVTCYPTHWQITAMGRRFANNLQMLFLSA